MHLINSVTVCLKDQWPMFIFGDKYWFPLVHLNHVGNLLQDIIIYFDNVLSVTWKV